MYSGALEEQAKRKATSILQDELNHILHATRELAQLPDMMANDDREGIDNLLDQISDIEDDVESHRRRITKEVADVGGLVMNRENLLNAAYTLDEIAGYITGISFKMPNIKIEILKTSNLDRDLAKMIGLVVEEVYKLKEVTTYLNTNSAKAVELAQETQKIERQIDLLYRQTTLKALNNITSVPNLFLIIDVIENIEEMADHCQKVSDAFIVLAFSL